MSASEVSGNFNYEKARGLLTMERAMELIHLCDKGLTRDSENVEILRLRAEANCMVGNWSSAHDDLFLVVKIASCDRKAMENLKFVGNKSIPKKLLAPGYRLDKLISWKYDQLNSDPLGVQMARALGEPETSSVTRLVEKLGASKAMELLELTRATEAEGGLMLVEGSRRRTPGETFALLCKNTPMPTGSHGVQNSDKATLTADNKIKNLDVCSIEDGGDNNSDKATLTADNKIKNLDVCSIEDGGDNNSDKATLTADNKIKSVHVCNIEDGGDNNSDKATLTADNKIKNLDVCSIEDGGDNNSDKVTLTADNKIKSVHVCNIEDGGDNALMFEELEDIFAKIRENPGFLVDYADCPQVMSMLMERGVVASSNECIPTNKA